MQPHDRTEYECDLQQSGHPRFTNEQQAYEHGCGDDTGIAAVTHEVRAEYDKAQDDRDVEEYFLQA